MNRQQTVLSKWARADFVLLENTGQYAAKWSECANSITPWVIAVDKDPSNIGKFVSEEYVENNKPILRGFKGA